MRTDKKRNIDKIQSMTIEDWYNQAQNDEHLTPTLCFMCAGCEKCGEQCAIGIKEYLKEKQA